MNAHAVFEFAHDWRETDRRFGLLDDADLMRLANAINEQHKTKESTRMLTPDQRFIGLFGDRHIARVFGLRQDYRILKWGDGRKPFTLNDGTIIDVMTRKPPKNALYPDLSLTTTAKRGPDVVILVAYSDPESEPIIMGWLEDAAIRTFPVTVWREDVSNYVVPHGNLHDIGALIARHDPAHPLAVVSPAPVAPMPPIPPPPAAPVPRQAALF